MRSMRLLPLLAAALLLSSLVPPPPASAAAEAPPADPGVRAAVARFIESGEVAGAVTLIATKDGVLHLDAAGMADLEAGRPMRPDAVFWIASMSKPITATAVMMLQDEGKLSVDDPVGKYVPELGGLKTRDGRPVTITIRQMLMHTSGMSDISSEEARGCLTLADAVKVYATKPVNFEPGSRWSYCQSSINAAARVVEVVSGMSFPEFLEKRLFGPLGMRDTTFYLSDEQHARLARSYARKDGTLEPAANYFLMGKAPTSRDRFPAANGGLFSTAGDYARFCRMILSGGELDGKRYLKPETVKLMTTLQSGELRTGFTPGNGWGIGWCVVREPQGVTAMLSPGTHGHGGAYGTQAWIDPVKGRAYILMVQRANFPNADNSDLRKAFQEAGAKLASN